MKPYDFKWTKFYESNSDFQDSYSGLQLSLTEDELVICSTVIDYDNYSIVTTQRLITKEKGIENSGDLDRATDKLYGDFKGHKGDTFTFGLVQMDDGGDLKYFIETGKASMIMIHGVRTLIKSQQMTNTQADNVTRIWNRKSES
ncbi:hypothetical protein [Ohtaekwangia koreensis]|nr:hypothetical protein [Ohtaekwangia koreensis]